MCALNSFCSTPYIVIFDYRKTGIVVNRRVERGRPTPTDHQGLRNGEKYVTEFPVVCLIIQMVLNLRCHLSTAVFIANFLCSRHEEYNIRSRSP